MLRHFMAGEAADFAASPFASMHTPHFLFISYPLRKSTALIINVVFVKDDLFLL